MTVDDAELLEICRRLVAFDTVSTASNVPCAEYLAELTGCRHLRGAPFATDGGQLEGIGIHSVICGPGELSEAHRPDESLPITHLRRGAELIREVVARLCC